MKINRLVLMALLSLALSLFIPISSKAIHKGAGELVCGNCHTMHSSQGGTNGLSMGGSTGSFILLRSGNSSISSRAEIHNLCLQCHASNGTQADIVHAPQGVIAPKVYSSGGWTGSENQAFRLIGAGGNFAGELNSSWDNIDGTSATADKLGRGHSLGATNVTPPGGEADPPISEFTCTNCHDPHGTDSATDNKTNRFRNLKLYPTGANSSGIKFYDDGVQYYKMRSYVGGVNGTYFGGNETDNTNQVIWPIYRGTLDGTPANDSNNSNSYATGADECMLGCSFGNIPVTMSVWCAQCHDKWHEDIEPSNRCLTCDTGYSTNRAWFRHPVNAVVPVRSGAGCAGSCHSSMLDRSNYNNNIITQGKALPVTAAMNLSFGGYGSEELVYYLPFPQEGLCTDGSTNCMDIDSGNTGATANHKVFCLTCHFAHAGPYFDNLRWNYTSAVSSGSQSGNGVPSNVGCQLCHNR